MTTRIGLWISIATLPLAACGQDAAPARQQAANETSPAVPAPPKAAPSKPVPVAEAPGVQSLSGKGIAPALSFGMARADALAAAAKAFGPSTGKEHNDECGEAPRDFVSFHDLQLAFDGGRLVGWSLGGATPPLRTAGGLAIGAPRSLLGGAQVDEEGSLGPEFEVDGVGGILDEKGVKVAALWAGQVCQFR